MDSIIIEPLREPRTLAFAQRRSLSSIPADIVGVWSVAGKPFLYEFTVAGDYLVHGTAPFAVAADGLRLDINGTVYERVFGAGAQIVGVWAHTFGAEGLVEELYFRADGSYTAHWSDGEDYLGSYAVNGGTLSQGELRAIVDTSGSAISFDPPYGVDYAGTYALSGDTLSIAFGAVTIIYERVV